MCLVTRNSRLMRQSGPFFQDTAHHFRTREIFLGESQNSSLIIINGDEHAHAVRDYDDARADANQRDL